MKYHLKKYLESSEIIDFKHSSVLNKAKELALSTKDEVEISKTCFEFVRDKIFHCVDYNMNPVTLKASEVLEHETGFCFAKSHLLVALLRANSIPAGLCYQRVVYGKYGLPFSLHGFVAVYLNKYGWYRIDARGNNDVVNTQFNPPEEQLAFKSTLPGEYVFPEIWDQPIYLIIEYLNKYSDYKEALKDIPDIEVIGS